MILLCPQSRMMAASNLPRRESGLTPKQRTRLAECFDKLHMLSFEPLLSPRHGLEMTNTITIPYSTSFHYVPQAPTRSFASVQNAAALRKLMRDAGAATASVSAEPQSGSVNAQDELPWAPERLMEHRRPILASYVGMGAARKHAAGVLWQTKTHVRPPLAARGSQVNPCSVSALVHSASKTCSESVVSNGQHNHCGSGIASCLVQRIVTNSDRARTAASDPWDIVSAGGGGV